MHHSAPVRTFLCRSKQGLQRKDFSGKYGIPGFHRGFASTTGLESFSEGQRRFPKYCFSVVAVCGFIFPLRKALFRALVLTKNKSRGELTVVTQRSTPRFLFRDRPNTASESTVSNTELSEFLALTEFCGESWVGSSQPMIPQGPES